MIRRVIERVSTLFSRKPRKAREPRRIGAEEHGIDPALVARSALRVSEALQKAGFRAYLVGGAVRDLLLGIAPKDFDIATNATPDQVKSHFRRAIIIGRRFRLVHVMFGQETIEVSTFRALDNPDRQTDEHGRVVADNLFGEQHEDAARRDFTVNALYYAILIGHSLGGHIALEYARRVSAWTRGLILVNPFYSRFQLPVLLRNTYGHNGVRNLIASRIPEWMFRLVVDMTSVSMGHSAGAMHSLPEKVRAQTALDYKRTAPGVYSVPNDLLDLTDTLHQISMPTLVVWGDRDKTLAPASFPKLVEAMPRAVGRSIRAGHVPHQSNAAEFNKIAFAFLNQFHSPRWSLSRVKF